MKKTGRNKLIRFSTAILFLSGNRSSKVIKKDGRD